MAIWGTNTSPVVVEPHSIRNLKFPGTSPDTLHFGTKSDFQNFMISVSATVRRMGLYVMCSVWFSSWRGTVQTPEALSKDVGYSGLFSSLQLLWHNLRLDMYKCMCLG